MPAHLMGLLRRNSSIALRIIDDVANLNLWDLLNQVTFPLNITLFVAPGVTIRGSHSSPTLPSLSTIGLHPASTLNLVLEGAIRGRGGFGGQGAILVRKISTGVHATVASGGGGGAGDPFGIARPYNPILSRYYYEQYIALGYTDVDLLDLWSPFNTGHIGPPPFPTTPQNQGKNGSLLLGGAKGVSIYDAAGLAAPPGYKERIVYTANSPATAFGEFEVTIPDLEGLLNGPAETHWNPWTDISGDNGGDAIRTHIRTNIRILSEGLIAGGGGGGQGGHLEFESSNTGKEDTAEDLNYLLVVNLTSIDESHMAGGDGGAVAQPGQFGYATAAKQIAWDASSIPTLEYPLGYGTGTPGQQQDTGPGLAGNAVRLVGDGVVNFNGDTPENVLGVIST